MAYAIPRVTPMVLHLPPMATKHRRIALTADPELEAAIAAARHQLGDAPESRLVRELALRGARELEPDPMARIKAEFEMEGIEWPDESMGEYLRRGGHPPGGGGGHPPRRPPPPARAPPPPPDDPYRMTRILEEVREDTV
jgi:hypothetical protein